jgi:hypothetical protein
LTRQAPFAEEVGRPQDGHNGFFTMPRNNGELDLAFLDVKEGIGGVALRENRFILAVRGEGPSLTDLGQKALGIEGSRFRFQKAVLLAVSINVGEGLLALGLLDLLSGLRLDVQFGLRMPELVETVGHKYETGDNEQPQSRLFHEAKRFSSGSSILGVLSAPQEISHGLAFDMDS